jgi:hypothetical protein
MDDDKIQKQLEFILNSRAQFYTDSQKVQEITKQLQEISKDSEKRTNTLGRGSLNLYNTTVERGENIARLTEDIKELRAAQKETNRRFEAVIVRFRKFLDNQNGAKS